jgi:hypothetical protein
MSALSPKSAPKQTSVWSVRRFFQLTRPISRECAPRLIEGQSQNPSLRPLRIGASAGAKLLRSGPRGPFFRVLTGPGWAPSGDPPSGGPKAAVPGTSVKTVDNHLMTVREKFKIDDTGVCLSESYKRGLIKY